ncbi:hypothetical protein BCR42DRAFT_211233 [Absidia repens]|uniref:GRF-type domain-containing protein n=1 Tax=Absidia repens TaxID=90262 RepID=A0A1X2IQT2_9FUNG|nr:hypothetical protein BCR42DRAFT_211233 [Absidia repens]
MSSIPQCKCGRPCLSKEAYRGGNRGRWYWKCASTRCGYFQWNDPGPHVYTPIVFTAPHPTTTTASTTKTGKALETHAEPRDSSALHIEDISYPLGAKRSRLASTRSKKRRLKTEMLNSTKTNIILTLYTNTDISVQANKRHRYIQTLFRTLKGIEWIERLHRWVFSADLQMYERVWKLLYQHRATFDVIGVPFAILRYLPKTTEELHHLQHHQSSLTTTTTTTTTVPSSLSINQNKATDNNDYGNDTDDIGGDEDLSDLPISWFDQEVIRGSKLWQSMTSKQRAGVKKGMNLDGGIYLHDSIGSGQSLQALAIALMHQNDWPALIVCRPSACLKWKKLIQIMLQLVSNDICLLDNVSAYNGKKVYSNSRKAIQSREYRQRRREMIQQQLRQGLPNNLATATTTTTTIPTTTTSSSSSSSSLLSQAEHNSGKDGLQQQLQTNESDEDTWHISMEDDGGDKFFPSGNMMKSGTTSLVDGGGMKPVNYEPQQQLLYIDMKNDGGDNNAFSDEKMDDDNDTYDSDTDGNNTYDMGISTDNTYISETINSRDTSATLVEENGDDDDDVNDEGEAFNQAILSTAQFFIISYDKAKTRLSSLKLEKFKIVIFDDCHDIKTTMMPTYRTPLAKFVRSTKKTIMVSSIPIIPKPMETFPLLQILKPNLFLDSKYFGQRYCGAKHLVFGWDYTGTSNEFELAYFLDRTVLVP